MVMIKGNMNVRQKSWITRTKKTLKGMDSHERAMEINARSLLLYNNVMWPSWEIIKVREYLLKN